MQFHLLLLRARRFESKESASRQKILNQIAISFANTFVLLLCSKFGVCLSVEKGRSKRVVSRGPPYVRRTAVHHYCNLKTG